MCCRWSIWSRTRAGRHARRRWWWRTGSVGAASPRVPLRRADRRRRAPRGRGRSCAVAAWRRSRADGGLERARDGARPRLRTAAPAPHGGRCARRRAAAAGGLQPAARRAGHARRRQADRGADPRGRSGGPARLRAIGVLLAGEVAQVSMNVERPFETPLAAVVEAVARHAPLASAELVGLAPAARSEGFPPILRCRGSIPPAT